MADTNERWGVIHPVEGWCKNCAYNLNNPILGVCEMFTGDVTADKPYSVHFEGKECPLFLEKSNENKS